MAALGFVPLSVAAVVAAAVIVAGVVAEVVADAAGGAVNDGRRPGAGPSRPATRRPRTGRSFASSTPPSNNNTTTVRKLTTSKKKANCQRHHPTLKGLPSSVATQQHREGHRFFSTTRSRDQYGKK